MISLLRRQIPSLTLLNPFHASLKPVDFSQIVSKSFSSQKKLSELHKVKENKSFVPKVGLNDAHQNTYTVSPVQDAVADCILGAIFSYFFILDSTSEKPDEKTPLNVIDESNLENVRLSLDAGVDPDICTENGWTALSCASMKGNVECVRLLLENHKKMT